MNALSVENLSKTFTIYQLGQKTLHGLRNVSFQVKEGGSLALFGPSGIGKSSVLKCIYRTYVATSGNIRYRSDLFGEVDLSKIAEYEMLRLRASEIGYVTQFLKVIPRVSAVDVVAEPLLKRGMHRENARQKARMMLERLNIPPSHLDAYPVTFSGGEQQRVNIARALIGTPRLLLLDEPTASLDTASIQVVIDLLNELRQQGTTMVMIFHDPKILNALADTLYPMQHNAKAAVTINDMPRPSHNQPHWVIEHGRVITRDGALPEADVVIEHGRIAAIKKNGGAYNYPRVEAAGLLVLPGFIDLHSDAIEKEIQPRPGGRIPVEVALVELDKRLASCGVTTMFHCIAFVKNEKNELRTAEMARGIANLIQRFEKHLSIHNRIHARFEMMHTEYVALLEELIAQRAIHLFSIMDHTPGQGQFTSLEHYKAYYNFVTNNDDAELDRMIAERMAARTNFDDRHIRRLTQLCAEYGIPMASHDDDLPEKVHWVRDLGIQISEFPVTLAAARMAHECGLHVLMGAPNILRGKSLTGNLSGREAIEAGYCDLIGSDHSPSNILHAVFLLHRSGVGELHELVNMVSYNPARAVRLDHETGSIAVGLSADLTLVDNSGPVPRIVKTFVDGKQVFSAC